MSSLLTLNYFTPFPSFPVADFKEVNICGESYLVLSSLDICFNVSTRGRQDLTRSNVWHSVIFLISHTQWCNLSKPSITQIIFFYIRVFFHGHLQFIGQQGKREHHLLFHFSTLPLFHSSTLTFRHLFCNFARQMILLFPIAALVFTRLLLDEIYHLTELLFDWLMMWCWFSFVYLLIWFKVFVTAIWYWKPVDSNSHRLSSLYYKQTD